MTFGSLFSGIGGFDLGLERAGLRCIWQVEIDDYATKVLEKHWPNVARFRDVRECGGHNLEPVDLICGGFPCQDVSLAGSRQGLKGKRTTLWSEFHRIICEIEPNWILAENVPGLLSSDAGQFFGNILRDLAQSGYDAEWHCLPAAAFGAPYFRDRIFVLAFKPNSSHDCPIPICTRFKPIAITSRDSGKILSQKRATARYTRWSNITSDDWWHMQNESKICRVADGISNRMDRIKCLGNSVVPQVAEWIGERIKEAQMQMRMPI